MKVAESEDEQTLREAKERECKEGKSSPNLQLFVGGTFNRGC